MRHDLEPVLHVKRRGLNRGVDDQVFGGHRILLQVRNAALQQQRAPAPAMPISMNLAKHQHCVVFYIGNIVPPHGARLNYIMFSAFQSPLCRRIVRRGLNAEFGFLNLNSNLVCRE